MLQVGNPFPLFFDEHGALVDAGQIYVGTSGADPQVSPIPVYWDSAFTIPAVQPLRTRSGVIVNNGAPAIAYVNADDYSERVLDADGNLVSYVPSAQAVAIASFQPLSDDLTAIDALATTSYGRSLLTAATAAAARALLGIVASLPLTGGTMTGNILRSGAGPHQYHVDGTFVSGRKFYTAAGAADPTSQVGDEWWQYSP
jgi:hypothetical protein